MHTCMHARSIPQVPTLGAVLEIPPYIPAPTDIKPVDHLHHTNRGITRATHVVIGQSGRITMLLAAVVLSLCGGKWDASYLLRCDLEGWNCPDSRLVNTTALLWFGKVYFLMGFLFRGGVLVSVDAKVGR
ncbi:unnamed protein product [Periconia digitata]|uniref:Uncharacterized protein n=1 Tax=Periconia digitata TaxID=1303443 RepID=A0A9W4XN78_9PLEO|nr:unnamed protein product [Periconia digitata]